MNSIKRSFISLTRQPIKSSIFLLLIFILGILISGAIAVHHAIMHTNQNLRSRIPAITMIEYDLDFDFEEAMRLLEETGEWPEIETEVLTREIIYEIGDFPQVSAFDYSINLGFGIVAEKLEPWLDSDFFYYMRIENGFGVEVEIGGVGNEDFLDIRSDFLDLIVGRGFTEEDLQLESAPFPTLIATGFAEVNGFSIGSIFNVRVLVYGTIELENGSIGLDSNSTPILGANFPLEVVGIFEPLLAPLNEHSSIGDLEYSWQASQMQHRIYVSNSVAETMLHELVKQLPPFDMNDSFAHVILLNDPLAFEEFAEAVSNLAGNWRAVDYSRSFDEISVAMLHLRDISNMILIIATISTIIIVSLITLLFLHDRKHEIGVYLSLGSMKKGIIFQIVLEVIILAFIGMTFSLFVGNLIARNISQEILRQELMNPTDNHAIENVHWLEEWGYRFSMTHDDMLDAYEIQLGTQEIVWFYIAGLGTIMVATILPIVKIVKTNPKKVLL